MLFGGSTFLHVNRKSRTQVTFTYTISRGRYPHHAVIVQQCGNDTLELYNFRATARESLRPSLSKRKWHMCAQPCHVLRSLQVRGLDLSMPIRVPLLLLIIKHYGDRYLGSVATYED